MLLNHDAAGRTGYFKAGNISAQKRGAGYVHDSFVNMLSASLPKAEQKNMSKRTKFWISPT